jgi:hypothetical protein
MIDAIWIVGLSLIMAGALCKKKETLFILFKYPIHSIYPSYLSRAMSTGLWPYCLVAFGLNYHVSGSSVPDESAPL